MRIQGECGFLFFQEFLLWEFPTLEHRLHLQGANVHNSSKNGGSFKRATFSSPREPWYMSVVDTETGCYKDVHCSTHESPRLFQAWSKGQKPREETVRRTEEVLEIMSPTGLFFFFFHFQRHSMLFFKTISQSAKDWMLMKNFKGLFRGMNDIPSRMIHSEETTEGRPSSSQPKTWCWEWSWTSRQLPVSWVSHSFFQ